MHVSDTPLDGVKILTPVVHRDERGFFLECWNNQVAELVGGAPAPEQVNHSRSKAGVLRGIHFQWPEPQAKLVRLAKGRIWDVAVDLRRQSPTFGKWFGLYLDDIECQMLWVPEGFGHGFLTISEEADISYSCNKEYIPANDKAVAWNDDGLAIDWPLDGVEGPILSDRDRNAPSLSESELCP